MNHKNPGITAGTRRNAQDNYIKLIPTRDRMTTKERGRDTYIQSRAQKSLSRMPPSPDREVESRRGADLGQENTRPHQNLPAGRAKDGTSPPPSYRRTPSIWKKMSHPHIR